MAFICLLRLLTLLATISLSHAQCAPNDATCFGARALHLTNNYRRQSGHPALLAAPGPLQRNARQHSVAMMRRNALFHQDFEGVHAGCGQSLFAENVAMHHDVEGDWVAMCVQLWIESPPHRANLLAQAHSMAFAVLQRDGRVWCTQTFGRVDDKDASRKCRAGRRRRGRMGQKGTYSAVPVPDGEEGEEEDDGEDEVGNEEEKEKESGEKDLRRTSISNVEGSRGQKCYKICIKEQRTHPNSINLHTSTSVRSIRSLTLGRPLSSAVQTPKCDQSSVLSADPATHRRAMVVETAKLRKVLSSYQNLGTTAFTSISASYSQSSIHDVHSFLRWFLLEVPVVPVLITFHCLFAATQIHKPGNGRHFWFKSLVLTTFAAFGGGTLAHVFSGAPPPLFTTGSNFMLCYVFTAWYLVHTLPLLRSFLSLRPVRAVLAFGAMAAKARSIFSFVDTFVARFPGAATGAIVLGGIAGSGGSLFVAFERKLRLGSKAPSELSRPGWGFKSAYLAAAMYYIATDPDGVMRGLQIPLRNVVPRQEARFAISMALCGHAAVEALVGRHINPLYFVETILYAVARVDQGEQGVGATPTTSAVSDTSQPANSRREGPPKKPRSSPRTPGVESNKTGSLRQRKGR